MKPYLHGNVSVKKWGGKPEDYQAIHDFLDSSKSTHADMRHRAIFHNSLGPYVCERIFGINITNSDGKTVSVRDIAEQHIIDDMGRIPSVSDYLNEMPFYDWLGGRKKEKKHLTFDEIEKKLTPQEKPFEEGVKLPGESTADYWLRRSKAKPFDPDADPRIID